MTNYDMLHFADWDGTKPRWLTPDRPLTRLETAPRALPTPAWAPFCVCGGIVGPAGECAACDPWCWEDDGDVSGGGGERQRRHGGALMAARPCQF